MKTWWVDRHSRVVVRGHVAVVLSFVEFAIFTAFRTKNQRIRLTKDILDEIYSGVVDPPLHPHNVLCQTVKNMNHKLKRINLAIKGRNQRQHSSYRLVDLKA